MTYNISDILTLPIIERLTIIVDICDSLEPKDIPKFNWHIEELENFHANPDEIILWNNLKKRFEELDRKRA